MRKHIYSDEDIQIANNTSILDLAKKLGYQVRDKPNQRWAEIRGQGGLSIDKIRNRWYCHSAGQGGGPIQLIMFLSNLSWKEAMNELIGRDDFSQHLYVDTAVIEEDKDNFTLPDKDRNYYNMYAYLIKSRFIHPDIVQMFVDKKLLYQNTKKSCVFVGTDKQGIPRHANIRSTNTVGAAFKGDAALSDKRFGFAKVGTNDTLTAVESPIDVLSYMTIYKLHGAYHKIEAEHVLSLNGSCDVALEQYLKDHPEITKINLGLDNDKAGNKVCEAIKANYSNYDVKQVLYTEKDMNELLKVEVMKLSMKIEQNRIQGEKCKMELEPE